MILSSIQFYKYSVSILLYTVLLIACSCHLWRHWHSSVENQYPVSQLSRKPTPFQYHNSIFSMAAGILTIDMLTIDIIKFSFLSNNVQDTSWRSSVGLSRNWNLPVHVFFSDLSRLFQVDSNKNVHVVYVLYSHKIDKVLISCQMRLLSSCWAIEWKKEVCAKNIWRDWFDLSTHHLL